jgi:hypothetical protein
LRKPVLIQAVLADAMWIADPDRVEADASILGDARGAVRRHRARGVVSVGQDDGDLFGRLAGLEHLDRQTDCVAEGGPRPGHAGPAVGQHRAHRRVIERERHERYGASPKATRPMRSPGRRATNSSTTRRTAAPRVSSSPDGARKSFVSIDCDTSSTSSRSRAGSNLRERRLDILRPRERDHDQRPGQRRDELLQPVGAEHDRPRGWREPGEPRDVARRTAGESPG